MRIYDLNKDDDSEDDDIRHFGDVEKDPDEESDTDEDDGNKKKVREALWFILYIAIIVAVAFIIVKFIGQRTVVSGRSMENTLSDGDNLIMDKITYRIGNPKRFDIVIFPDPSDPSEFFYQKSHRTAGRDCKDRFRRHHIYKWQETYRVIWKRSN